MGYRYPAPILHYEGEADTPFEGVWIDVRKVRHGAEYKALTGNALWMHLFEVVAPFVIGWNVEGAREVITEVEPATDDKESVTKVGFEVVVLPPPAEAGPDILKLVELPVLDWILFKLIESTWHRTDDPKALTPPSASTQNGSPTVTSNDSTTLTVSDSGKSGASGKARRPRTPPPS